LAVCEIIALNTVPLPLPCGEWLGRGLFTSSPRKDDLFQKYLHTYARIAVRLKDLTTKYLADWFILISFASYIKN
jgi:hypothetical protein